MFTVYWLWLVAYDNKCVVLISTGSLHTLIDIFFFINKLWLLAYGYKRVDWPWLVAYDNKYVVMLLFVKK